MYTSSLENRLEIVWSPCTSGMTIETFLSRLSLPPTYEDIRQYWKVLGSPYLDALRWPADSEEYVTDLGRLVSSQSSSLYHCIDTYLRVGTELPRKSFEEVGLYIFNRSCLLAELKVREYGWSNCIKEKLCRTYARQSLALLDIDRTPCLCFGPHKCLYELVWGEIVTMSSEDIRSRYQNLFCVTEAATDFSMSPPSTGTSPDSASGGGDETTGQIQCSSVGRNSSAVHNWWNAPFNSPSLSSPSRNTTHVEALAISCDTSLNPHKRVGTYDTFESLSNPGNTLCLSTSFPISPSTPMLRSKTCVSATRPTPKRKEMRRSATDDCKLKVSPSSSSVRKRRERSTFVFDMTLRFQDTFLHFDKGNFGNPALHNQLRELLMNDPDNIQNFLEEINVCDISRGSIAKVRKRRSRVLTPVRNEGLLFGRISGVASILNTISPALSNKEVVELSARDMQTFATNSTIRYQHALLDTWHLYRGRWDELVQMEQRNDPSEEAERPIARLVQALKTAK